MANHLITTIPLFLSQLTGTRGTGGTALSDAIDMRDIGAEGACAITYSIASTNGTPGEGTAGSSVFSYLGCRSLDGTYVAAGTFGTLGASAAQSGILTFTSIPVPFIKIQGATGTSNPAVITAELHVR